MSVCDVALDVCVCTHTYAADIPINDALSSCGFARDESNADETVFNTTIMMTTYTDMGIIRGDQVQWCMWSS